LGKPFTVNGVTFPETVTVIQTGSNDPLINKQQGKEVYAKGVGLIYRELMITEAYTDPQFLNLPYDQRIRIGFKLTMKLTDYNPQ
jgi:catabolite regulation protein CreA